MRSRTFSNAVVSLVAAGSFANFITASPATHQHGHQHVDKRVVVKTVEVPGPIVIEYEFKGTFIDKSEVCEGIANGTLAWADDNHVPGDCPLSTGSAVFPTQATSSSTELASPIAAAFEPSIAPATTPSSEVQQDFAHEALKVSASSPSNTFSGAAIPFSSSALPTLKTSRTTTPQSAAIASAPTQGPSTAVSSNPVGQGLNVDFPDGEIDCTDFPSKYGPINIEWAGLGGWSGIQYVTIEGDYVTHIDTAVPGGDGCKPGAMCSYACPAGYQKSQWPVQQGATGQSIGGLSCNSEGKLSLTNPELSKNLCIEGTGAVTVHNKLSNNAAICRTDYPGTEDEVVPLNTEPNTMHPLTCPDAATYFKHNGDPTSAQYYINNQGIPLPHACTWSTDGSDMGNWAPSYLGVGQDMGGKTWLSISSTAQNDPISYTPLNFTVQIAGHTSGTCRLSNGKYCSGENYEYCNTLGCTVELISGQATYILADGFDLST